MTTPPDFTMCPKCKQRTYDKVVNLCVSCLHTIEKEIIPLKTKEWIDKSSYETLLNKWRHAPIGDPIFQGPIGEYYSKVMFEKKKALSNGQAVQASKNVGWE